MKRKYNNPYYIGITGLSILLLALVLTQNQAIAADSQQPVEVIDLSKVPESTASQPALTAAVGESPKKYDDFLNYTFGQDDILELSVLRHPEFSGIYTVSMDGKIQCKFVGDIDVTGLTKRQLEEKLRKIIGNYVINPEVDVTIKEYKSKIIFVLGEVAQPGKFYMRSEGISVREAVVQAGLPTLSASMRKCHLITPDKSGRPKIRYVDVYSILYGGDLKKNIEMHPGEVLYVPSTIMAKVIRVINPISQTIGVATAGPESLSGGKSSVVNIVK